MKSHPRNDSYEVIVVGAGAAGLSAAIFAAQSGAKTLVIERTGSIGGTSALSGGWMWVPGASRAKSAAEDSRQTTLAYIHAIAGEHYRTDLVDAYLDHAPDVVRRLERLGLKLSHAETAPDYNELCPGALKGGRAISADSWDARRLGKRRRDIRRPLTSMRVFGVVPQLGVELDNFVRANQSPASFIYVARKIAAATIQTILYGRPTRLTNGNALVGQLYKIAIDSGVRFLLQSRVTDLSAENGRVNEVEVTSPWGQACLGARGGVILTCGGISHNLEWTKKYFPHVRAGLTHSSATIAEHDGDAIRLAQAWRPRFVGAVSQPAAWAPVTVFGSSAQHIFPHLRSIGLPGLVALNQNGERFTNEADSYHDFGQSLIRDSQGRTKAGAYLMADAATMGKYGVGYAKPFPIPRFSYYQSGYLVKGRTLDEIARKCGFNPETLKQTIAQYNADADQGIDSRFSRGDTFYNRFRGDKLHQPNPSIGPIGQGPYYAIPITIGDLGAFAGLDIDAGARALNEDSQPIPGLFVAGSASVSPFGGGYPGYGAMLGPAIVMGAIAGQQAAADARA
ncbi:MAG: FAD-dependent oxidoreductase [Propionibacteriaceae bacterium]|nr:FAD-dependent oxidoreductase [Propionibacteriaceae bacterium]